MTHDSLVQPHSGLIPCFRCHAPADTLWGLVLDKILHFGSGTHRRGRLLRSPALAAHPSMEAGEKQGTIHTPPVTIRFFGQYLSFGQVGPSPCKVHAMLGKHRSSESDCTVSIHHRPHWGGEAQPLF